VCATGANFEVHAGKKFSTQIEECKYDFPVYLRIHHVQCKYTYNNTKNLYRNEINNLSCGVAAVSTFFYQIH
jgi:hypothetical protein